MKKLASLLLAMLIGVCAFGGTAAFADGEGASQPLPDFSDSFEDYEVGKIEDNQQFRQNWDNDYFSGSEENAVQQTNVASVEYENGESGNKVLRVNNIEGDGSFFFISAGKASRYKNFNVSFRVKVMNAKPTDGGWFGINCRKEADIRYNNTNGMLLTYRWYNEETAVTPMTYRFMPGAQVILSPEEIEEAGIKYATYSTYGAYEAGEGKSDWINYRMCVNETSYKLYANDMLVADFTCDRNALDIYGYVSFNVCVCDLMMDDFYLENLDEEAPPADEEEPPVVTPTQPTQSSSVKPDGTGDSQKKGCGGAASAGVAAGLALFAAAALIRRKR